MTPQECPLNPKAVSLGELYGEYDLSTNEWTDGVLSSLMRAACAGTVECSSDGNGYAEWLCWAVLNNFIYSSSSCITEDGV